MRSPGQPASPRTGIEGRLLRRGWHAARPLRQPVLFVKPRSGGGARASAAKARCPHRRVIRYQLATDAGGWRQINRAGHPMMWPIFWPGDTDFSNPANTRHPSEDFSAAAQTIGDQIVAGVSASGTSADPEVYRKTVARRLFPDVPPYVVGTPATYSFAAFNGRTLADNAPEAMLSLVTNSAVPSGLTPSVTMHLRDTKFPYVVPQ
jgi:hypothetical protein